MFRFWVWLVKSILGIAQFAVLNRLADRTGLRHSWLHPVGSILAQGTGISEGRWEIVLLAFASFWLVWVISALCGSLSASLSRAVNLGAFSGSGSTFRQPRA
jgi:hypothetical protein